MHILLAMEVLQHPRQRPTGKPAMMQQSHRNKLQQYELQQYVQVHPMDMRMSDLETRQPHQHHLQIL